MKKKLENLEKTQKKSKTKKLSKTLENKVIKKT